MESIAYKTTGIAAITINENIRIGTDTKQSIDKNIIRVMDTIEQQVPINKITSIYYLKFNINYDKIING